MMFGINRCHVSKAAVNAMLVMPGVAAITGNGGASLLGEQDGASVVTVDAGLSARASAF
jgi:hypothetical protein